MNSLFGFGRPLFRLGRDSGLAFGLLHSDDFASRHRGGLSAADVARRRRLNWLSDRHWWRRTGRRRLILRCRALALLPEAYAKSEGDEEDGHADADRDGPARTQPSLLLLALGSTLIASAASAAVLGATDALRVALALFIEVRPEFRRVAAGA